MFGLFSAKSSVIYGSSGKQKSTRISAKAEQQVAVTSGGETGEPGISTQLLLDDQRGIKKGQAICKKGLFSHFLSSGISVPSGRISLARAKGISGVWVGPPEHTY